MSNPYGTCGRVQEFHVSKANDGQTVVYVNVEGAIIRHARVYHPITRASADRLTNLSYKTNVEIAAHVHPDRRPGVFIRRNHYRR